MYKSGWHCKIRVMSEREWMDRKFKGIDSIRQRLKGENVGDVFISALIDSQPELSREAIECVRVGVIY